MADKFLKLQHQFIQQGRPTEATIAFHYTAKENLESIGRGGLYIGTNTSSSSGARQRHGAVFGRGIYVGNNPHVFSRYGTSCVICLVLRGVEIMSGRASDVSTIDTLVGNKPHGQIPRWPRDVAKAVAEKDLSPAQADIEVATRVSSGSLRRGETRWGGLPLTPNGSAFPYGHLHDEV